MDQIFVDWLNFFNSSAENHVVKKRSEPFLLGRPRARPVSCRVARCCRPRTRFIAERLKDATLEQFRRLCVCACVWARRRRMWAHLLARVRVCACVQFVHNEGPTPSQLDNKLPFSLFQLS